MREVQRVTMFKSTRGELFNNIEDARRDSERGDLEQLLVKSTLQLPCHDCGTTVETVATWLVSNREQIIKHLMAMDAQGEPPVRGGRMPREGVRLGRRNNRSAE